MLRVGAPGLALASVIAAVRGGVDGLDLLAVAVAALVLVVAAWPTVGADLVDGSSYGPEKRLPLRVPPSLALGPAPLAVAVVLAGVSAGPLLLATGQWALGAVVTAVGGVLAVLAARSLHALSRRFLVFVPGGVVVHDPLTLVDPVLLPKTALASVGPAPADSDAEDLTMGAGGLVMELRLQQPSDLVRRRPGRAPDESVLTAAVLVAPTRTAAFLTDARDRNLPGALTGPVVGLGERHRRQELGRGVGPRVVGGRPVICAPAGTARSRSADIAFVSVAVRPQVTPGTCQACGPSKCVRFGCCSTTGRAISHACPRQPAARPHAPIPASVSVSVSVPGVSGRWRRRGPGRRRRTRRSGRGRPAGWGCPTRAPAVPEHAGPGLAVGAALHEHGARHRAVGPHEVDQSDLAVEQVFLAAHGHRAPVLTSTAVTNEGSCCRRRPRPRRWPTVTSSTAATSPTWRPVSSTTRPRGQLDSVLQETRTTRRGLDEADVLAVGLGRGPQAEVGGPLPHLGLGQIAHRQQDPGEGGLVEHVQDVGLVLGRRRPRGRCGGSRRDASTDPGVVAGGHGVEAEDLGPLAAGGRT